MIQILKHVKYLFSAADDEEQESTDEKEHTEDEGHTYQEDNNEHHKDCNKEMEDHNEIEKKDVGEDIKARKVRMNNKWRILKMFRTQDQNHTVMPSSIRV